MFLVWTKNFLSVDISHLLIKCQSLINEVNCWVECFYRVVSGGLNGELGAPLISTQEMIAAWRLIGGCWGPPADALVRLSSLRGIVLHDTARAGGGNARRPACLAAIPPRRALAAVAR